MQAALLRRARPAFAAALLLAAMLGPVPAWAGPLEEGIAAFERGDFRAAKDDLEPLAIKGDAVAQYYLGDLLVRYAVGPGKEVGVNWLKKSASAGVPDAMNSLATLLAEGKFVAADQAQATALFMQAASLGYLPAYYNLGLRSYEGVGRPRDPLDASEWFRLAADQGLASAQFSLGVLYAGGEGVKFDIVEAYKWMTLAMKQGHPQAAGDRKTIAEKMTPAQIHEAEKRVAQWKPVKTVKQQAKPAS